MGQETINFDVYTMRSRNLYLQITIISNTSLTPNIYPEKIYQTTIVTSNHHPSELIYKVDVDLNKSYVISLHFVEISANITVGGQRVFDILVINRETKYKIVDIIGVKGKLNMTFFLEKNSFCEHGDVDNLSSP